MPRPRPNGNNNLPGKPPICPPLGGSLFRRGMRSPLPKSQFSLPRPYPINVRARRALRIYYLLSFIYYLLSILPRRGTLVPDGAPIRSIPGNCNKKTPLLPPLICTLHSFPRGLSRGLTKPHRGFVVGRYARRPTRPVLVPDGAPVRNILGNRNKKTPRNFLRGVYFGAPSGTRTQDPLIKSQLLYQVASTKSGVLVLTVLRNRLCIRIFIL